MSALPSRRLFGQAALALLLAGCSAATTPYPASAQRGLLPDFADLAERVLPAVVNIAVTAEQRSVELPPELRGTPFERYFRDRQRGRRQEVTGAGSGFVIDPTGYIVTNNHVVGNASRVVVSLQDGTELPARVIGTDELTDLALLKVEPRGSMTAVPWGVSAQARVGSWVLAAGNPFGLGGSVTSGIISARGREIGAGPFDDFIQTDAAINPGNSGGPLFNAVGEVIGINTAIYSPSGASAGIGFATPSDLARPVIEQLRREGRVERGWLGVAVQDLVSEDQRQGRRGVLVAGIERNSPAGRAGLRQGDIVIAINGDRVDTSRALVRTVAAVPPGQTVRLTVVRDGREREVPVQVGRRPGQG
ncbi:trypsin-like peptidase domain-containing protein [Siccirubricoccus sp. KC 17139]|uniref:Trypsin-like peptidase domain-containing protein n=1 Tax=Siccirubricoccus soli TaxID=2899147 RepID=A0ABT1D8L2_9PROT|nr:trypsin-like peptidase domain-containing protein [Siccirubricoccus soli]MCO6418268.1 trypsin-like peptidase domain-containing protein [Siccirubricoccus soli]MCP2684403.1 trypsin-like peptidase domain-containing protein [Siccirubricoccus soli]